MGAGNGGLYQVRHRVYDPHAGRWLQRDPAGFVDGCNLYEYCMGGPGAGVDPYGQSVCRDFIDGAKQLVDILSGNRAIDDSEWERQRAAQDARNREGMQDAADNGHISQEEADQRHRRYQAGQNADTHQLYRTREFEDDLTTHMIETAAYEAAAGLIGAGVGRGLARLAKRYMGGMFGRLMDRFRRSTSGCTATPTGVHCWVKHAMGAAGDAPARTTNLSKAGRAGKQSRLRDLESDPNVSSADRGWIRQELNSIARGQRSNIRVPPGKNLAHRRGFEAKNGYGYQHSDLQDIDLHKLQHKHEGY